MMILVLLVFENHAEVDVPCDNCDKYCKEDEEIFLFHIMSLRYLVVLFLLPETC